MKFEANIPSYLKTGQGIFPVKESSMPKRIESTNFYENAKQGFNMPTTNETSMPSFAPVSDITRDEPMDAENFLEKMQDGMNKEVPSLDIKSNKQRNDLNLDAEPVMPMLPLEQVTPPKELMAGKKPLPGQQTLPGDFPTTGEMNDKEAADKYDDDLEEKVIQVDEDVFIG